MEKLEKIIGFPQVKTDELKSEEIPYEGLVLLEDRPYNGPTSIKYWM